MKKILDRIWEWMKTTAWFQVVILVGAIVALVLCINPITKGISGVVEDAKRVKYYENNRITYNEIIEKIGNIDSADGEEFAVIFGDPTSSSLTSLEEGIQEYSNDNKAVKIYLLNTMINEDNKTSYNQDSNYYDYFKVTLPQLQDFHAAANNPSDPDKAIYDLWKEYSDRSNDEVNQTSSWPAASSSIASCLSSPTLMWFRSKDNIDPSIKDASIVARPSSSSLSANFDFHIAKVYQTIADGSGDSNVTSLAGITKFFNSSLFTA